MDRRKSLSALAFLACSALLVADSTGEFCASYQHLDESYTWELRCCERAEEGEGCLARWEDHGYVESSADYATSMHESLALVSEQALDTGAAPAGEMSGWVEHDQSHCDSGGYFRERSGEGVIYYIALELELGGELEGQSTSCQIEEADIEREMNFDCDSRVTCELSIIPGA